MRRSHYTIILIAAITLPTLFFYFMTRNPVESEPQKLKILCAGSLLFPLERVVEEFEEEYPQIDVELEGHGSIQVIRHPTELNDPADLLLVADYSLIPVMMYNKTIPSSDLKFSDWYIRFSGNNIVLAYTEGSKYVDEVDGGNWFSVLARQDVKIGLANPIIDALGYRSLMVVQLAESYYDEARVFEDLIGGNFDPEFDTVAVGGRTVIFVPELEQPIGSKISVRASSIQIIPLLESGAIDYTFLYLSNAKQYGVRYLELPGEVDLGSDEFDEAYSKVQVRFQHQRFKSIGLDRVGATIHYGLTIPKNALNPESAVKFIEYILAGEGKNVFESVWHPVYSPSHTDNIDALPEELRHLVEPETSSN